MRFDVSEIKEFRGCTRKWELTSRNRFHLQPKVTPPQFIFGTIFHEALHSLYMNTPLDKVMEQVRHEMCTDSDAALLAMIPGYAKEVLPEDLDRFRVLDIEHKFDFVPEESDDPDLHICGSIDMIVLDPETNKIYGFEHKTCKNFRDTTYMWMDEQPRVYTRALQQYIDEYNARKLSEWAENFSSDPGHCGPEPIPATLGGIYLNEVKKLLRQFQYRRSLMVYPEDDLSNFFQHFVQSCKTCKHAAEEGRPGIPNPDWFKCQMCEYRTICETYQYQSLEKAKVLQEFAEEFQERETDHLDEKVERVNEGV